MKKTLFIILAIVICAALVVSCAAKEQASDSDWAGIEGKGKMVIGYTVYDPMNYFDEDGTFIGFDTEYATAVCEKLGVEPDFVEIDWSTKEVELSAGNIDTIWNGLTVTEERKENMDFTNSYMENKQVVVIKADNSGKFKSTADLTGGTVAAEAGSTGEDTIVENEDLSQATFVGVTKQTDALLEVKAGTADAAVIDYTTADAMVGEGTDYSDLMIMPGSELSIEEYAVGCRVGSDLTEKINEATAELVKDGTMEKIAEKYGLEAILIK